MKKLILFTLLLGMMPYKMLAQDDMYILPSNLPTAKKSTVRTNDREVTYSGSDRDVDEYNRHGKYWSHYQKIGTDNRGNDVIEFQKGRGVYPDSTYIDTTFVGKYYDTMVDGDDFEYTSRMSRWDGYYNPWFYSSYRWRAYPYWRAGWGFYDPWYDPWYYGYAGFYDPWYSSWYGGYYGFYDPWYNPWYYGYSGWYGSYYRGWYSYPYGGYGRGYARVYGGNPRGLTGDRTWRFGGSGDTYSTGRFARGATNGNRQPGSIYTTRSRRNRSFGGRTDTPRSNSIGTRSNSSFGNSTRSTPSYNSGGFGGSRSSGGGFGGTRSSGGGFGGGHSSGGGGGHFGGGRR